jgi:hypothetical protein
VLVTIAWWARWLPLLLDMLRVGAIPPWALLIAVGSLAILIIGAFRFWRGAQTSATFIFHIVLALIVLRALALDTPAFAGPSLLGIAVAAAGLAWMFFTRKKLRAPS